MIRYFIVSYISHHRLILILYLFHIYRGLCKKLLNWLEVGSRTSTSVVLVAWCWCILLVTMPVSNSKWHNDRDTCFCVLVSGVVVCVRREAAAAMPIVHRLRFATSSRYMPPQPLLRRCLLLPWQHALCDVTLCWRWRCFCIATQCCLVIVGRLWQQHAAAIDAAMLPDMISLLHMSFSFLFFPLVIVVVVLHFFVCAASIFSDRSCLRHQ